MVLLFQWKSGYLIAEVILSVPPTPRGQYFPPSILQGDLCNNCSVHFLCKYQTIHCQIKIRQYEMFLMSHIKAHCSQMGKMSLYASKLCIMDHVRASFMALSLFAKLCIPYVPINSYLSWKDSLCTAVTFLNSFFNLAPGLLECLPPEHELRLNDWCFPFTVSLFHLHH